LYLKQEHLSIVYTAFKTETRIPVRGIHNLSIYMFFCMFIYIVYSSKVKDVRKAVW